MFVSLKSVNHPKFNELQKFKKVLQGTPEALCKQSWDETLTYLFFRWTDGTKVDYSLSTNVQAIEGSSKNCGGFIMGSFNNKLSMLLFTLNQNINYLKTRLSLKNLSDRV